MKPVEQIIEKALREKLFSGVALGVMQKGSIVFESYQGKTSYENNGNDIHTQTLFDLASLTKVFVTGSLMIQGLQDSDFELEESIETTLKVKENKYDTSLQSLLCHQSGFTDHIVLKKYFSGVKSQLEEYILDIPLAYSPGDKTIYSDLDFILLGLFLEKKYDCSLSKLWEDKIQKPWKLDDITFLPLEKGFGKKDIVATQKDMERGGLIQGEVHDGNCHFLGGVCGHAGLFGSLQACLRITNEWLKGSLGTSSRIEQVWVKRFVSKYSAKDGSFRGLAWDLPTKPKSTAGSLVSNTAFGHLGYTGTSVWIDVEREALVCLLSNRVHPEDENKAGMFEFRSRVHDAIWKELDGR